MCSEISAGAVSDAWDSAAGSDAAGSFASNSHTYISRADFIASCRRVLTDKKRVVIKFMMKKVSDGSVVLFSRS